MDYVIKLLGLTLAGLQDLYGEDCKSGRWARSANAKRVRDHIGQLKKAIDLLSFESPENCPCCGSDKIYRTMAVHCNRCATTTEI